MRERYSQRVLFGERSADSFGCVDGAVGAAVNDPQQVTCGRYSARTGQDPAVAVEYEKRWDAQDVMITCDIEVIPGVDRHPMKVGTRLSDLGEHPLHGPAGNAGWGCEQKSSNATGGPVKPNRGKLLVGEAPVPGGHLFRAGGTPSPAPASGRFGDPPITSAPPRSHDEHDRQDRDDDEETQ